MKKNNLKQLFVFLQVIILFGCVGSQKITKNLSTNLNGYQKIYYENGNLKSEGDYEKNSKEGFFKFYYENGNKKSEGLFKNDMKQDVWKEWYVNGMREITYKDNSRNSIKCWSLEGKNIDCNNIIY